MNKFQPEPPRTFSQAVRALRDEKVIACHRTQEALAFSVWRRLTIEEILRHAERTGIKKMTAIVAEAKQGVLL